VEADFLSLRLLLGFLLGWRSVYQGIVRRGWSWVHWFALLLRSEAWFNDGEGSRCTEGFGALPMFDFGIVSLDEFAIFRCQTVTPIGSFNGDGPTLIRVTWRNPDVGAWLPRALCFRRRTRLEGKVSTDESLEFAVSMV